MDPLDLAAILAHAGHAHESGGAAILAAISVAAMVIPLAILGFIGRAFWRSAQRDSEKQPR